MTRIAVQCNNPKCQARGFVDAGLLGKRVSCQRCGGAFDLKAAAPVSLLGRVSQLFSRGGGFELARNETPKDSLLFGDFVVERPLGEGGMGVVTLVRSKTTGERFAVKKTKFANEKSRRNFLTELQTWIDLPDHPHLTACRFFRTEGDEVAVFAEYVDGGSLHDWIRDRKLTRLEDILDVAIQFAWGLHAAHEAGLVHQDVKPGNVLLTAEGLLKVTDFGLARARGVAGETPAAAGQSVLVSCGGMTPAYCSPEQAVGQLLSRKTDVWSWGVAVLEMFTGEVTWRSGTVALKVLEAYVMTGAAGLPRMPAALVEVLRRCFRHAPAERWANLDEVSQQLQHVYEGEVRCSHPRQKPAPDAQRSSALDDRRDAIGTTWADPREYLDEALRQVGRDCKEAEYLLAERGKTRKGQAVADLAAYEEARQLFQQLITSGRKDLENHLATLCVEKALIHGQAGDRAGEFALFDQAIAIWERLVHQEGHHKLETALARAYTNKAVALSVWGDTRETVALYDQAIAIWERLVHQEGRRELLGDLATIYMNKANAVGVSGDKVAAVALHDQAIAIWERLVHQEGRRELADELAKGYMNKALDVGGLGDNPGAVALYDQAIAIWECLVNQEGRRELANDLAKLYMNKAVAVRALGDNRGAVALFDQAIAIWERLVHQEGRRELAHELANVYTGKANAVRALGDHRGAVALYDQAIAIHECLVHQEDRRELAYELANVYTGKANAMSVLGDHRGAVALYDQAIAIRERLVHQADQRASANDLATEYMNKAIAVSVLGDHREAVALFDQAIAVRERLVHQEGRHELLGDLAWIRVGRATELLALGESIQARWVARAAVSVLKAESERTGRADLTAVLNWARSALAEIL